MCPGYCIELANRGKIDEDLSSIFNSIREAGWAGPCMAMSEVVGECWISTRCSKWNPLWGRLKLILTFFWCVFDFEVFVVSFCWVFAGTTILRSSYNMTGVWQILFLNPWASCFSRLPKWSQNWWTPHHCSRLVFGVEVLFFKRRNHNTRGTNAASKPLKRCLLKNESLPSTMFLAMLVMSDICGLTGDQLKMHQWNPDFRMTLDTSVEDHPWTH